MNVQCIFGYHKWDHCKCVKCHKRRDEYHAWNGCKCSLCDKSRDDAHDWSSDCGKCARCGKERNSEHSWIGCKCSLCDRLLDEAHDWSDNCNACKVCGFVPPYTITIDNRNGYQETTIPPVISEYHQTSERVVNEMIERDCRAAVVRYLPRFRSIKGVPLYINIPYRGISHKYTSYYDGDPWNDMPASESIEPERKYNSTISLSRLHFAAQEKLFEEMEWLLANGADVNTRNRADGSTPLHKAASIGCKEMVKFLLDNGADVNIQDYTGRTAMNETPNQDIATLLTQHGGNSSSQNLICWTYSKWSEFWVREHLQGWNHTDWLNLVESLRRSKFWPMDEAEIGRNLEMVRVRLKSATS